MILKRAVKNAAVFLRENIVSTAYKFLPAYTSHGKSSVLVAPPGNGNIGDQAMVEAYVERTPGQVKVVVRDASDVNVPEIYANRMTVIELGELIYGRAGVGHLRDVRRFIGLARRAERVDFVGADIMDGAYNLTASVRRSSLAGLSASLGTPTRVLGFSWNDSPELAAAQFLRRASKKGVRLLLRDPMSAGRARKDGLHNVSEVSDTVFSGTTIDESILQTYKVSGRKKLALINISAHIQNSVDQLADYRKVVTFLIGREYRVLLVPHVGRPRSDDRVLAEILSNSFNYEDVCVVEWPISPAQVRSLCSCADIVVTGRMHLSIIALSQAVPAIILASQGKVEGLSQMFPGFAVCIQPKVGMAEAICRAVKELEASDLPAEQLDVILSRSLENFM